MMIKLLEVVMMISMEKEAMVPLLVLKVLTSSQVQTVPMKNLVEREMMNWMEVTEMINWMEVTGMMNYQVVQELI